MIRVRELFFVSVLVQFGDTDLIQFLFRVYRIENVGFRGVNSGNTKKTKDFFSQIRGGPATWTGIVLKFIFSGTPVIAVFYASLTLSRIYRMYPLTPGKTRS